MSPREHARIRAAGVDIPDSTRLRVLEHARGDWSCPALTEENRCAVYDIRPMICRLWGAMKSLRCGFGCQPATGWLTDIQAQELLGKAMRAGGSPTEGAAREAFAEHLRRNPRTAQTVREFIRKAANNAADTAPAP
jgi:Fe-S-cluster containining protein